MIASHEYPIIIPPDFLTTTYDPSRIPGSPDQSDLSLGANCQVFAYELLRVNGLVLPDFRSSDLWEDRLYTDRVSVPEPLDLMLYNTTNDAYGAHVGLCVGGGQVIHLSAARAIYEIIEHTALMARKRYAVFIGAKRVRPVEHQGKVQPA